MADCIWEGDVSTDPTVAGNWSTAAVPQAADDVIFDSTAQDNCIGGDLTANQVATVTITSDCTIDIGTSAANALDFDCNGVISDKGSGTHYLNCKNTTFWNHYGSGTCSIDGIDNDELMIDASGGTITVGPLSGVPAEFAAASAVTIKAGTVTIDYLTDQAAGNTDLVIQGGTVTCNDGIDILTISGGTLYFEGDQAIATAHIYGGKVYYNSTGNITTMAYVYSGGELTFEDGYTSVTVADIHLFTGATLRDPHKYVTWTAPPELHGCKLGDVTIDLGVHRQYAVTDI